MKAITAFRKLLKFINPKIFKELKFLFIYGSLSQFEYNTYVDMHVISDTNNIVIMLNNVIVMMIITLFKCIQKKLNSFFKIIDLMLANQ